MIIATLSSTTFVAGLVRGGGGGLHGDWFLNVTSVLLVRTAIPLYTCQRCQMNPPSLSMKSVSYPAATRALPLARQDSVSFLFLNGQNVRRVTVTSDSVGLPEDDGIHAVLDVGVPPLDS